VNWRFCGESVFQSWEFSLFLAIANLALLAILFFTRWTRPSGLSAPAFLIRLLKPVSPIVQQQQISIPLTPPFIMTTVLSSMMAGMLCARSLHYQFYAYIDWATPYLLWKSNMHPVLIYTIWAVQELAWNVYPSTGLSSAVVVGCLAIQVLGAWWGTRKDFINVQPTIEEKGNNHQHTE
jgi:alpha-1,3-mannosyltransferase